ncbi:Protein-glutamate methylesterase/protein-glutamine glutaminase [Paenibacillus allorhizoplanae]|uniref:Protein-glutamate methylesterase/protein-glutamine glutaminase n=1 Tax=Paenibacillus allorhizoplanae TaxID=2905648 RepID=A0ABM9C2G5_9BACL|nr:response regulator [Paenibacillus allorhizoplanae]CAH1202091.1 Protein-glutamate methylesterase/protein-glutamine glutaminase [Paenibacillus allorhizoplanae]
MHNIPIKVLIVDDELPLRQELRSMPWHLFGAELVGEAENGEEALQLCEELKPDLVITDIIMPIMDGMDLLRQAKQRFPCIQFVLLTSHSDFQYAQQALKLGALEYVLKLTFEEEEMKAAVDKARAAIRRESDLRSYERERKRRDISQLLNTIEMGEADQAKGLSQLWEAWCRATPYYPVRLHVEVREGDRFHLLHELKIQLERLEKESSNFYWSPIGDQDIVFVFCNLHSALEACTQAEQVMRGVYQALEKRLTDPYGGIRLLAVTGGCVREPEDLISSLRASVITEVMKFYDSSLTSLTADKAASGLAGPEDSPDADQIISKWIDVAKDKEKILTFFHETLAPWAMASRFEPEKLIAFILRIRERVITVHSLLRPSEYEAFTVQLQGAPTFVQLLHVLVREQESEASGIRKIRNDVQLAQKIILTRLTEAITLTSISEEVGLSSSYFSRLFREETGESFNDYVTRMRIEKAMELLQTTQLKVYEVAERVGIPSYRYFSQLFRNWTGVAPNEYKRADFK